MKRATIALISVSLSYIYFNPRPREEGDLLRLSQFRLLDTISIHALVKRATYSVLYVDNIICISIHALVKRATRGDFVLVKVQIISIHALVKRATLSLT